MLPLYVFPDGLTNRTHPTWLWPIAPQSWSPVSSQLAMPHVGEPSHLLLMWQGHQSMLALTSQWPMERHPQASHLIQPLPIMVHPQIGLTISHCTLVAVWWFDLWCVSQSATRDKSWLFALASSPPGLLNQPLLGLHRLCWSVLITPDQVPWASPHHIWCCAFWCQCPLAELCVDISFYPMVHTLGSSPQKSGLTISMVKYHLFWAPSIKTSPRGEEIRWTDLKCPCSAEWAFQNHQEINSHLPATAHLFGFETSTGSFQPMRKHWFLDRCNEIWSNSGFSVLPGHSFRIGGTTHLLLLGVDPFIVMAQGRWKSTAFLEYWRLCEEIIPTFVSFSLTSQSSLLSTMSLFKQWLLSPL